MGSLQTYELLLPQPKKNKSIVLKTVREEADDSFDEESLIYEDLALFAKRFSKLFRPRRGYSKNKFSKAAEKSKGDSNGASQGKRDKDKKDKNSQGIKCHECSGESSLGDSNDEDDLQVAYNKLFEECIKLKKNEQKYF